MKHTLVAKVADQPGVLNRVASLFRRRAFNIDSLTVGHTETQEFFHDKRYAATPMLSPDFVKLAGAYDIPACRVSTRGDVVPAVQRARETKGPALIEFRVEKEEAVYPMVPAGSDLDAMIRRPAEESAGVRS